MAMSSQKFIARNRAPRVQIEYDVEVYGAEKKVQLPFVMGVMADLSGKPTDPLAPVADRKFLEIDIDNFDNRLKAMKPRVAFRVPNTLTGEGELSVDLSFESMEDFSPAAVAQKVDSLNRLLQARQQLSNLMSYMDGKTGAEELIAKALNDPSLLQSLVAEAKPQDAAAPAATARYLAFDGLRKLPLVTNTANKVDAGNVAPDLTKLRSTRFKMAAKYSAKPSDLAWLVDGGTYAKFLAMSEFLTMDKAGPLATAQTVRMRRRRQLSLLNLFQFERVLLSHLMMADIAGEHAPVELLQMHVIEVPGDDG